MIRWGKTKRGKVRWRCSVCAKTGIKTRSDRSQKNTERLFEKWLLTTETLSRLEQKNGHGSNTLTRRFSSFWLLPVISNYFGKGRIIIVDGIRIGPDESILIAIDGDGLPIAWIRCIRETSFSWSQLFAEVKKQGVTQPVCIVSDAQKGLLLALKWSFGLIPHQRCMTHVVRLAHAWLTRHPQTTAGIELRLLVSSLYDIKTKDEAILFKEKFSQWLTEHADFLKEKSLSPDMKRWWYTHKKLRWVKTLIARSLPDLFTFLDLPKVPRTTNGLEGGINSPIKALIRHHRGMSTSHKRTLAFRFLRARQKRNTNTKC
ncbi:MAG: transposase [Candidatus Vogelbacteria bacterium]|nr:transposase [Candidatus Vogelbacteria bacterium]